MFKSYLGVSLVLCFITIQTFQILDMLTVIPTENQCRAGRAPENVDKNRFRDLLPSKLHFTTLCSLLFRPNLYMVLRN